MIWARMLAYITGTVDQELLLRNEYLAAENRILRAQIKGRLLLSDAEKATLAEIAPRDALAGILPTPTAGSDDDVVAVADEWYSNPVVTAVAPLRPARAGSQTAWLPVLLRPSLPATANRSRPPPPVPATRGPFPVPSRNCELSGVAPTPTQTVTAGLPLFSAWTFSWPAPCSPLSREFQCRVIVQRRYRLLRRVSKKTFRSKPNAIPVDDTNCSPSHRNHVHLQTGMLFGITTESCSASDRNRVRLRPDSPAIMPLAPGLFWAFVVSLLLFSLLAVSYT